MPFLHTLNALIPRLVYHPVGKFLLSSSLFFFLSHPFSVSFSTASFFKAFVFITPSRALFLEEVLWIIISPRFLLIFIRRSTSSTTRSRKSRVGSTRKLSLSNSTRKRFFGKKKLEKDGERKRVKDVEGDTTLPVSSSTLLDSIVFRLWVDGQADWVN